MRKDKEHNQANTQSKRLDTMRVVQRLLRSCIAFSQLDELAVPLPVCVCELLAN